MKYFIFSSLIILFFTSCCHFTSQECSCNPPEPFLIESTKEWIQPQVSQELTFISQDTILANKIIYNTYKNEKFFIGGDECGTNFPSFSFDYKFDNTSFEKSLITVKAIMDIVQFTTTYYSYNQEDFIADYKVLDNQFYNYEGVSASTNDTLISNLHYQKVIFKKTNPKKYSVHFNELTFVKGIGVISFVDTSGIYWVRN